ncbi:MAG TPA: hypothetical protein PKD99_12845 [Sphingopyxis sp.]|nr:hypothetical protein [Sphingopyxis sp.]HMP45986.1 hypothetical protein [Sphingopyxis sp.]HMQ17824.1 hypothetical protein [Sphingopyxis sp.]
MKLYDAKYGHEVASVSDDGRSLAARWGRRFSIKGTEVFDQQREHVGFFHDGRFSNLAGDLMAEARA